MYLSATKNVSISKLFFLPDEGSSITCLFCWKAKIEHKSEQKYYNFLIHLKWNKIV